jgi:hypothetical protein
MDDDTTRPHPTPDRPPGWSQARPEHIPRPTYWPAVLAFGLTFALWGLLTTWIISVVGIAVVAIGLLGWIGDLRHEH